MVCPLLVGALVMAALPVHVESGGCPSGRDVERSLAGMLRPASEGKRPDLATIFRQDGKLHVVLTSPDAAVIGERSIDRDGSCEELAVLSAVVIASWMSDIDTDFAQRHAELAARVALPEPRVPETRATAAYDIAVGAVLSASGSLAAGGTLAGFWLPRGAGVGLHASFQAQSARTLDFYQGQTATWRRWGGSAEIDWRVRRGVTTLDLHGGLVVGWLTANGEGFSRDLAAGSFCPGGTVGLRLAWWATRALAVWLQASGTYWSRTQTLYFSEGSTEHDVPHVEGLVGIGVALGKSSLDR